MRNNLLLLFAYGIFLCLLALSVLAYHQNRERVRLTLISQEQARIIKAQKAHIWADSICHQIKLK